MSQEFIDIKGASQNNLKNLDLQLPLNELIVITGVSGSGKSSLAFDTIYAEGQRRYVETFSPYARQFLERMDKPRVERIAGIPPAIAIDQTNPVRTSRSTVGTMTELNDHLKLLFARAAQLYCRGCGQLVERDTPESIVTKLVVRAADETALLLITFLVRVPANFSKNEIKELLTAQGYTKIQHETDDAIELVQDRVRLTKENHARLSEAVEAALRHGQGRVMVNKIDKQGAILKTWRYSVDLHCADCDIFYQDPIPSLFSFNSPLGACETCRGFGRVIGVDYGLVIPDENKTLAQGAIKPWQTASYQESQDDLLRFARKSNVPVDIPWREMTPEHQRWVLEGEGRWGGGKWYGVQRFFAWLETKAYKMHIRVLLAKYRAYTLCPGCQGARLKPEALLWRIGTKDDANRALAVPKRFKPQVLQLSPERFAELPGLTVHDMTLLPIERCLQFFRDLHLPAPLDAAADLLLSEIRARLTYLVEVGLGYLNLDRQSRTLSGGEVQRINLTTALGTSLVNTLFVLDEPSIGLHPRDIERLIRVLQRLRNAGNSLLVVEHDPQVILAADRIIDVGPGPGEHGGAIVFAGTAAELMQTQSSLTADYLAGRKKVDLDHRVNRSEKPVAWLTLLGAEQNNLQSVDIHIPLNRLVCITGVSGSGKSTLMHDVLYRAIAKRKGQPAETPGRYRELMGDEQIAEIVMVDQSPIGKTTRSNPASYVGAFDAIRKLFAQERLAQERGYSASTFSFNSGTGRCPACAGSGFEHVEMQFLSDVYLRCPDCDGKRYRPEVLEIKIVHANNAMDQAKSIADVLAMTVSTAVDFFNNQPQILRALKPLQAVGLSYLKLGQPVPTLSGGEAQRLKLAGHLAQASSKKNAGGVTLFLFDEPTTGLHFADIATLLHALQMLLTEGHSVVVIEHNLDVIQAADWLIDLGPEGGDAGGTIVAAGTPQDVARHEFSHTGKALRDYAKALAQAKQQALPGIKEQAPAPVNKVNNGVNENNQFIRIHHAREHNLKNIDVTIPRDRFVVITGISGSGKSTVAFDVLFAEGQRRYLASLNAYSRQFVQPAARPDVDAISGLPPTVAIEQRTSRGGRKSTVATLTEIYHFLRLLFVKLGTQYCPDCNIPIEEQTIESIIASIMRDYRGKRIAVFAPLVVARKGYYTDLAKWALSKGFERLRVDGHSVATADWPRLDRFKEHDIDLPVGEIVVAPKTEEQLKYLLKQALNFGKDLARIALAQENVSSAKVRQKGVATKRNNTKGTGETLFSTTRACPRCSRSFEELDPRLFSFNSKHGWCEQCYGTGVTLAEFDAAQTGEEIGWNDGWEGEEAVCPACQGKRLHSEALAVRFREHNIADVTAMPVENAAKFFNKLKLQGRDAHIARDILTELHSRLAFLQEVGLAYLSLDRAAPTLSGGEAQRIRLASQLGSNLRGVCYVLDEPTIGLHPRDNRMLLQTLHKLQGKGNTVVVVEHDEDTIRSADHVIDLGPGAGSKGGMVVAAGTLAELMRNSDSVTGQCLAHPIQHPLLPRRPVSDDGPSLNIIGASLHNLANVSVHIPLGKMVCVTGVSGSGKSTLVRHIVHDNLKALLNAKGAKKTRLVGCQGLDGWQMIKHIMEVDQTPIGKTPRSCPATYIGFWDTIRRLFAETPEARMRGYGPARFSFNVQGGRCEECEGQGVKRVEMSFLPDVTVQCEACSGARFARETLQVQYKGKTIADILAMNVDDAVDFFTAHPSIHRALRLLQDVGLGYLTLGQQSPTLSGGEAQRIKLVTELAKAKTATVLRRAQHTPDHSLYILDEPTIGLHMADVEKLIRVLHRLVTAGNSVIVIEHDLDVIAEADWIIDLGPEGGDRGGRIVVQGAPETVIKTRKTSYTAQVLAQFLQQRNV